MGRSAAGVRGIRLKKNDEVVKMAVILPEKDCKQEVLIVTEKGFGKKTNIKFYKVQKRGGFGIKTAKVTLKNGPVVACEILREEDEELLVISAKGQVIRIPISQISVSGRDTQGVRVMRLDNDDKVVSVTSL